MTRAELAEISIDSYFRIRVNETIYTASRAHVTMGYDGNVSTIYDNARASLSYFFHNIVRLKRGI